MGEWGNPLYQVSTRGKCQLILYIFTYTRAVGHRAVCATKYLIYNYNMVEGQERVERADDYDERRDRRGEMRV